MNFGLFPLLQERVIELEGELEQINAKVEELTAELQTQTELSEVGACLCNCSRAAKCRLRTL